MRRKEALSKLKIHNILWFLAACMLFIGIMNLQGSSILKDYRCLDGEVINIEAVKVLQKPGFVTRYNYTMIWYDDGVRYEQSVHEAIERPDESVTKIWVNTDNTDAGLSSATNAKSSAYIDLSIAMIAFIMGILFAPRKSEKRKMGVEEMESKYTGAILMIVTMVFGDLFMLFLYCDTKGKYSHINTVCLDLGVVFTIGLIISIVTIIKLKKKLKRK